MLRALLYCYLFVCYAGVSWLGFLHVLLTVALSFVTSNLTIFFDRVSVLFCFFLAIHCTPALCLLLFVLLSSAFWLYLLYFWYNSSCLLVLFVLLYRLRFLQFLKLEADIPFSVHTVHAPVMTCKVSFIQFLELLQMPTILRFLLSYDCHSVCDVPVLVQQLNPYLTTDMLFRLVVP